MKPEAQRIAIAEACGWDCDPEEARGWKSRGQWCRHPDVCHRSLVSKNMFLPDYLNSLDAMHEAEKVLDGNPKDPSSLRYTYASFLYNLCVPRGEQPMRATAAQRAESFLRTLNLWTE